MTARQQPTAWRLNSPGRWLLSSAALALILLCGLVHGLWTQRWHPSVAMQAAVQRLASVRLQIGNWQAVDQPLKPKHLAQAGLAGAWSRRYVEQTTHEEVTVLLMCGRPASIAVHTPDICYWGAGYDGVAAQVRTDLTVTGLSGTQEFWTQSFRKQHAPAPTYLRILWSWNAGSGWQAPDNPRLSYGRYAFLYKLYAIRTVQSPVESLANDPAVDLLGQLLPQLQRELWSHP